MCDFACLSTELDDDEARAYMQDEMRRRGARGSGCLLLQAPLWLLLALAAAVCWLVCLAAQRPAPNAEVVVKAGMLVLAGGESVTIAVARRWRYRVYYRRPVVIGAIW